MFSGVSENLENTLQQASGHERSLVFDAPTTALLCLAIVMSFGLGYFLGDKQHSRADTTVQSGEAQIPVSGRFGRVTNSALAR